MKKKLWFPAVVIVIVLLGGCAAGQVSKISADDVKVISPVVPVVVPGGKDVSNEEASFSLGRTAVWLGGIGGSGLLFGVLYLIRKHSRITDRVCPP